MNNLVSKFKDPIITAKGDERAFVDLDSLKTIWFNTGSLCNLRCNNCYIESSPKNDRLSFINLEDLVKYLDEAKSLNIHLDLVGFTGGEPFANPHMISILEETLKRGHQVLLLTNAFKVIKKYFPKLIELNQAFGPSLKLRVSLDHFTKTVHENERGVGTFGETLANIKFMVDQHFAISIAGRSLLKEPISDVLIGYQNLMNEYGINLKLNLGETIVIFPEMDEQHNVPEITTACWGILHKKPQDLMCSSERMLVKEKGRSDLTVMPCTLLAYDQQFKLGHSLLEAKKRVQLNHPFCAKFCVLGGASCSAK